MPEDNNTPVLYILDEAETFEWPVKVLVPADGKYLRAEFTAKFANLQGDELDALTASKPEGGPAMTDMEVADRVLVGWGPDLLGGDGKPLEFTPANKKRTLANHRVRIAVVGTFMAAARGFAAEKN